MTMGERLRLKIAGRRAGVHPRTVKRWQAEGKLTDHRTEGRHRRVDSDELDALLKRRRDEAKKRGG